MDENTLWLLVAIFVFIAPVIVLSIIVLVKIIKKQQIRLRQLKKSKVDYLPIFGGEENIVTVKRVDQRISIEVMTLDKVDFDALRSLNVGAMVVGNVIKCSSLAIAEQLEHLKK